MEYRFCPFDAGPLVRRALKAGEPPRLVCERCQQVFWLDPKVAAGTIFTVEGRIALVKRAIEPARGRWVFPGGFVDRGEVVADAAVRETWEEARVRVRIDHVLGVYSYPDRPVIIVYAATLTEGTPFPGDETLEVGLFAPDAIPWDELAFPSTREALRDYLARYFPEVAQRSGGLP
ncbi:MAG TPA: NUDIX hydrolase [Thermodesulfobacteriota bacterium]|nr:NUDIX hydrolase [Thermodesulfobacteriota bacterium]